MTPVSYADMTDVALRTDAGQRVAPDLPEYEPNSTLDAVVAALGAMSATPPAPPIPPDEPRNTPIRRTPNAADGQAATPDTIDIVGCAAPAKNMGQDSWGLVGTTVTLPNCAWEDGVDGNTVCTIDYFIGKHKFSRSTVAAYTVSYSGDPGNYAMRADFIMRHLAPAKRASLRKQPGPRSVPD